jgi:hypothetical protein
MWCRSCQQDVPVMRSGAVEAACPRCRSALRAAEDRGVELESFDRTSAVTTSSLRPPLAWGDSGAELRRIGRRLRPCSRPDAECGRAVLGSSLRFDPPATIEPPPFPPEGPADVSAERDVDRHSPHGGAASVAADAGFLAMVSGAATMAAVSEGLIVADYWRWGVFGCGIGGAVFALGVLRLATRAWRQGRELQAEMDDLRDRVDRVGASATSSEPHRRPSVVAAKVAASSRREAVSSRGW